MRSFGRRRPRSSFDGTRCDVYYRGYGVAGFLWLGISARRHRQRRYRFSAQGIFAAQFRRRSAGCRRAWKLVETIRREGAPIPLHPLPRWDDGHSVLLAGDAAGVVAPASGEGIYYAMIGGRLSAEAVDQFLETGDAKALRTARKRFMRMHGIVFWILGVMQWYWYSNDRRRERFVSICRDRDVQKLTWDAYMNKELVRAKPVAHVRIFFKNLAHMAGLASA